MISATDQQEAVAAGKFGVQAALNGETGKMVSFIREADADGNYQMVCGLEDVNEICNQEKVVPAEDGKPFRLYRSRCHRRFCPLCPTADPGKCKCSSW